MGIPTFVHQDVNRLIVITVSLWPLPKKTHSRNIEKKRQTNKISIMMFTKLLMIDHFPRLLSKYDEELDQILLGLNWTINLMISTCFPWFVYGSQGRPRPSTIKADDVLFLSFFSIIPCIFGLTFPPLPLILSVFKIAMKFLVCLLLLIAVLFVNAG